MLARLALTVGCSVLIRMAKFLGALTSGTPVTADGGGTSVEGASLVLSKSPLGRKPMLWQWSVLDSLHLLF